MRLSPGTRLGPYEIVSPLGAGGMGEVYRAKDTRLGRDVAIKVLPEHLTDNADVRARFEREARTISSLNHPHICTLHDVGRAPGEAGSGDIEYLVMELVDGETLATRIARGPLPLPEILKLATQIADALDRAHRAGVIHRDFKPGNVMITRSGAKLMDFGLARATAQGSTPGSSSTGVTIAQLTASPTLASPLTQQGSLIGTFLYMSPEQLEGREADARSDLWSFGCVLYEMATGRRAFNGKSQASLIGSIMSSEPPPISASTSMASPALDALVRACLAKDPEERIQTAHDVKLQLSWIAQSGEHSGPTGPIALPKRRRSLEPVAWAIAAIGVIATVALAVRGRAGGASSRQQIAFTIPIPPSLTPLYQPRISPDGTMLAFVAQDSLNRAMIWLRPMNALTANPLPGSENTAPAVVVPRQPVPRLRRRREAQEGRRLGRTRAGDLRRADRLRRHLEQGWRDPVRRRGRGPDLPCQRRRRREIGGDPRRLGEPGGLAGVPSRREALLLFRRRRHRGVEDARGDPRLAEGQGAPHRRLPRRVLARRLPPART
jgi:serine/threonine protein kinase